MMRAVRPGVQALVVLALAAATAGCATRSALVDHRMLLPDAGPRHALAANELFVMPLTLAAPEPAFPAGADALATADVVACAEIWLSADGDVTGVAPLTAAPGCEAGADPGRAAYAQSVAEAVRQWTFTPAMICDFPPQALDKRERGDCTGPDVTVRRVPVRLGYAFTFSIRDGRRGVGVARRPVAGGAAAPATR